ncbi:MAG: TRAP transporter permease [Candidatus Hodarchaeota archaeon]
MKNQKPAIEVEATVEKTDLGGDRVNIYDDEDIKGMPKFGGFTKTFIYLVGVLVSCLSIYEVVFGNFEPALQRPLHVFLMCMLTILLYPSGFFKFGSLKEGITNLTLIILLFASCFWTFLNWNPLYIDPYPTNFGIVMAIIGIFLVLEATRRAVGPPMAIIGLAMLVYCFVGPYMPRLFAHPGFSLQNVVVHTVVGTEGMMGLLLSISVNQIIFFMMFAAFLSVSNSTALFMNLAKAIAGGYAGGPAKVAVVASGFMGMVSGSASGNTATTGAITIPLMISMGFKRYIAAAIEAVSSTAGQFMPPIMGASAFVIAEYTGVSYWGVAKAAFIPSVIYFIGMYVVVDIESRMEGLTGLPKSELPGVWESFKKTVSLIIPIVVLVYFLSSRYSPQWAILNSLVVLSLICLPIKAQRMGIKRMARGLSLTTKILIPVATSCATCGLIVGVMSLTGLGNRLTYMIISVSQGNLMLGLLFTACVSILLGMGLPTLGAYVVLATLGAPALNTLGAPLLGAHLFIFYFAALSAITPPVCVSAFVAAGIAAEGNPMKVGFHAMRIGMIKYVIPFMFVFRPGMILEGSLSSIILNTFEMILVILPISILVQRYWLQKITLLEAALFIGAIVLVFPLSIITLPLAVICEILAIIIHINRYRRNLALVPKPIN